MTTGSPIGITAGELASAGVGMGGGLFVGGMATVGDGVGSGGRVADLVGGGVRGIWLAGTGRRAVVAGAGCPAIVPGVAQAIRVSNTAVKMNSGSILRSAGIRLENGQHRIQVIVPIDGIITGQQHGNGRNAICVKRIHGVAIKCLIGQIFKILYPVPGRKSI